MRVPHEFSLALVTLVLGCAKDVGSSATVAASVAAPVKSAAGPVEPVIAPSSAAPSPSASAANPADEVALRRNYGAADMRTDGCVKLGDDGVLRGRRCETVFAVFGPYVKVPQKSQVQLSFQIVAPRKVTVVSDMVSALGSKFHGSIVEERVGGVEARTVSYRVAFPDAAEALEARIGVRGEGAQDFEIKSLALEVH